MKNRKFEKRRNFKMGRVIEKGTKLLRLARKTYPDSFFVCGGPAPTLEGKSFLKERNADAIVLGEGEETVVELCDFLEKSQKERLSEIKGIIYRGENGDIISTGNREFPTNLNDFPFPRYDVFDSVKKDSLDMEFYPIVTSRGCPFDCSFCCNLGTKKWRFRSPENVLEELKQAQDKYNIKEVVTYDDNFNLDKDRVKRLCDLINSHELNLRFSTLNGVRADKLDFELLKKMKKAGFYKISLGVESGDPDVFREIGKGESLGEIKKSSKKIKKMGIELDCYFIIGLPHSTLESVERSIDFANELNPDRVTWQQLIPYPGTEAKRWVDSHGHYLRDIKGQKHHDELPVFETPEFSEEERIFAYRSASVKTFSYLPYSSDHPLARLINVSKSVLKYDRRNIQKHFLNLTSSFMGGADSMCSVLFLSSYLH